LLDDGEIFVWPSAFHRDRDRRRPIPWHSIFRPIRACRECRHDRGPASRTRSTPPSSPPARIERSVVIGVEHSGRTCVARSRQDRPSLQRTTSRLLMSAQRIVAIIMLISPFSLSQDQARSPAAPPPTFRMAQPSKIWWYSPTVTVCVWPEVRVNLWEVTFYNVVKAPIGWALFLRPRTHRRVCFERGGAGGGKPHSAQMRFETVTAFRSNVPAPGNCRENRRFSNRGRPGGTSIQSSERLSDVIADRPAAPRRPPGPSRRMLGSTVFQQPSWPPALQACRPGNARLAYQGRVHGRFRVETLIPTSFNQTPRL